MIFCSTYDILAYMIGYSLVNQKGQVTIPTFIRKHLKITPGKTVAVSQKDNKITIEILSSFQSLRGSVITPTAIPSKEKQRNAFQTYLSKKS